MTQTAIGAAGPSGAPGPFEAGLAGHLRFVDFDAFAAAAPHWEHRIQQIGRGRPAVRLGLAQTARVQLGLVRRGPGVRMEGRTPPGAAVFTLWLQGDARIFGQRAGPGRIAHLGGGEPFEVHDPGRHLMVSIALDEGLLERAGGPWQRPRALEGPHCAWLALRDAAARDALARAAGRWVARAVRDPSWLLDPRRAPLLEEGVVSALLGALDPGAGEGRAPVPTSRLARRAEEVIRSRLDQPITVRALAETLGMPLRTLHASFLGHFGMAPKAYQRALRLEAARRDLERAEPQIRVADVAVRWCFYHLGRFSGDYLRAFGELPSETLRRATRGAAPGPGLAPPGDAREQAGRPAP